jgi:hypothetical protein
MVLFPDPDDPWKTILGILRIRIKYSSLDKTFSFSKSLSILQNGDKMCLCQFHYI